MTQTTDTLLECQRVTKSYSGVTVLKDVDFEMKRGEIHAVVGENGAGKSTLIKIITGVTPRDSGEIVFDGRTIPIEHSKLAAQSYELNVITALVVGGTSLLGGSGSVVGALLGAIMVGFIDNGLNLMNVEAAYHPIVTGVVIIVALILNNGFELPKRLRGKVALRKQPAN